MVYSSSACETVSSGITSQHACDEAVPCSPSFTARAEIFYVLPSQVPAGESAYKAASIVTISLKTLDTALSAFGDASVLRIRTKPATNDT